MAEADLLLLCYTPITARIIAAARRLKVWRRRRNMSEIHIASRNHKSLRDQAPQPNQKKPARRKPAGFLFAAQPHDGLSASKAASKQPPHAQTCDIASSIHCSD
ncbi:hypothetical protein [Ensifer canadensis]|uniref:hypothetical protein n=1 Tax=Ensifer canadensis TaxID=555315 RepID=UPI001CED7960|nr:hypothetical protein [Ensifer canadensis]